MMEQRIADDAAYKYATAPFGSSVTGTLWRGYPYSAVEESTPVLTVDGFKQARHLTLDDRIISGAGVPAAIAAIVSRGPEDVYHVMYRSGRVMDVSGGALLAPRFPREGVIRHVVTAKTLEAEMRRYDVGGRLPRRVYNPTCRAVRFPDRGNTVREKDVPVLAACLCVPDEYLTAPVEVRRRLLTGIVSAHGAYDEAWTVSVPKDAGPDAPERTCSLARGLGYAAVIQLSRGDGVTFVVRILTGDDLSNPGGPPMRAPRPDDGMDEITDVGKRPEKRQMVCIAPESGVYNYIIKDYLVMHATLYGYDFDGQKPVVPWGSEKDPADRDGKSEKSVKPSLRANKIIFSGRDLAIYRTSCRAPDGTTLTMETASMSGAENDRMPPGEKTFPDPHIRKLVLLVFDDSGERILIEKRFVPSLGRLVYGFPSGPMLPGETIQSAVPRVLRETAGIEVDEIVDVLSPAFAAPDVTDMRTVMAAVRVPPGTPDPSGETFWTEKQNLKTILHGKLTRMDAAAQAAAFVWTLSRKPVESKKKGG